MPKKIYAPSISKQLRNDRESENMIGKGMSSSVKLCFVLIIISFLLYSNTLRNGYAGDDVFFIANNSYVNMGIRGIPALLTTRHMQGISTDPNDTYRPLSLVIFALENELFGNNPVIGHFVNIVLFCACVVILFLFFDHLMQRKKKAVAFIAALLFAIHPIHTEVVANIKSQDELLCFFFAFSSLNLYIKYFDTGRFIYLVQAFTSLFLSFLSKETSVCLILIIPLIFIFYRIGNKRRSTVIIFSSVISVLIFCSVRAIILHRIFPYANKNALSFIDNQLVNVPAGASRLATAILGNGYYIKMLFSPYPLLSDYSFATVPFVGFSDIWALLSLLCYIFLLLLGVYRLAKFRIDMWAFGILYYLISISLFTNVLFLIPGFVAERFVFFGSVGFCLLIALFIEKWGRVLQTNNGTVSMINLKNKALIFLAAILIVFSSITVARNKDWADDYVLNKADIKNAPNSARIYNKLGYIFTNNLYNGELSSEAKSAMIEIGIRYFKQAIAIYPDYFDPNAGIAQLYVRKNKFDSAEIYEKAAITLDSTNPMTSDNLGVIYSYTNRDAQALPLFIKALKMDPGLAGEYRNIGLCYFRLQKYDSAITYFREAFIFTPQVSQTLYQPMYISFREMGIKDSAAKYGQLMSK